MKKGILLFLIVSLTLVAMAQTPTKEKAKSDTTKTCPPSKSGKHCTKPPRG